MVPAGFAQLSVGQRGGELRCCRCSNFDCRLFEPLPWPPCRGLGSTQLWQHLDQQGTQILGEAKDCLQALCHSPNDLHAGFGQR